MDLLDCQSKDFLPNPRMKLIKGNLQKATFTKRLNRFTIECILDGKSIKAYLPNPGSLWELMLPNRPLFVLKNSSKNLSNSSKRCLPYTIIAAERNGIPILLHTHLSNNLVEWFLKERLIPGFEDWDILIREARAGKSRYDFLLKKGRKKMLLEVKNCTLFGDTVAMFPDAVTTRGSRHLLGLYEHVKKGMKGAIIFVVHWPHAKYFMPELHTDLEFARNLLKVKEKVLIKAIAVKLSRKLFVDRNVRELKVPWRLIEEEAKDRGSYIVILYLNKPENLKVGKLGTVHLEKGFYLYVGSAERGLSKRMDRHKRKTKKKFWHIDYLTEVAHYCKVLPIRTSFNLECKIASRLKNIADWTIPSFGCSDCYCDSHLLGMKSDPLKTAEFIELLMNFRIKRIERMIGRTP